MLEGELWEYMGKVYIVKGFQHPEDMLIAYPRYSLYTAEKIQGWLQGSGLNTVYWECIKSKVPVIPLSGSTCFQQRTSLRVQLIPVLLRDVLGLDEGDIYVSGSSRVLAEHGDVDIVVYGAGEDLVHDLENLVGRGVFKRVNEWVLVREYLEKHSGRMSLADYLWFKRDTVLHLDVMGYHVNLRPVVYTKGVQGCIDPVHRVSKYTGRLRVIEQVSSRLIPSRYIAVLEGGEEVVLESMREVYSELALGNYIVIEGRIEERRGGLHLVPDHGVLKPTL